MKGTAALAGLAAAQASGLAPAAEAAPDGASSVTRAGDEVRLTKTEWALLTELCQHPGKLLTHRWLLERVWGPGYAEDVDVLRVFISQLRKKLEQDPARPKLIATDPGIGYRWLLRPTDETERLSP